MSALPRAGEVTRIGAYPLIVGVVGAALNAAGHRVVATAAVSAAGRLRPQDAALLLDVLSVAGVGSSS